MGKKRKKKVIISIELNKKVAKEWPYQLTPREIESLSKRCASCHNLADFKDLAIPVDLIQHIKGKDGEVAYVEKDFKEKEHIVVIRLPLSLKTGKKDDPRRVWLNCAYGFFKSLFKTEYEHIKHGDKFKRITRKPYKEFEYYLGPSAELDLPRCPDEKLKYIVRYKTYEHGKPYGSVSGLTKDKELRNKEIRRIFNHFRHEGANIKKCLFQIKRWLRTQTIWNGRKGYKTLSDAYILKICYSKSM